MSLSLLKEEYQQDQAFPDTTDFSGLSEQEAFARLRQEGYNEIASTQRRSVLTVARDILREPMFLLLIAGGVIYLALGVIREALVMLDSILVIMGISLYQQQKTERALEALRDLSSPRALVIRGG